MIINLNMQYTTGMGRTVRGANLVRASTDAATRLRRKRAGGNTGKNFTEG